MSDEPIRCPKCYSTQIHVDKKGFSAEKAVAGGMLTGNVLVAAAAGSIGMNKIELTCLKCGHRFKANEAYSTTSIQHDRAVHKFEQHVIKEKEETSMYKCDCGKEACLPTSMPICPKCGRRLTDKNKTEVDYDKKGCLGILTIPIIITLIILL